MASNLCDYAHLRCHGIFQRIFRRSLIYGWIFTNRHFITLRLANQQRHSRMGTEYFGQVRTNLNCFRRAKLFVGGREGNARGELQSLIISNRLWPISEILVRSLVASWDGYEVWLLLQNADIWLKCFKLFSVSYTREICRKKVNLKLFVWEEGVLLACKIL